jgi:ferredoxin
MAKYKVVVIRDKCIGAASCVAIAPKAFKLDDEQKAVVLDSFAQESDDNLLLAAQSCPTAAIIVTDTETGEQVWPK